MFRLSEDLSSGRYQDSDILAIFAMPLIAFSMAAALSLEDPLILKVQQGVHSIGTLNSNIAAFASIAAAGSASRDTLLPAKGKAAVPPASCNNLYFCAINKQLLRLAKLILHVLSYLRHQADDIKKKGPRIGVLEITVLIYGN
jgi:hypothetical protein